MSHRSSRENQVRLKDTVGQASGHPQCQADDAPVSTESRHPMHRHCRIPFQSGRPDNQCTSLNAGCPGTEAVGPTIQGTTSCRSTPTVWAWMVRPPATVFPSHRPAERQEYRVVGWLEWLGASLHHTIPVLQHGTQRLFNGPQRLPTGVFPDFFGTAKDDLLIRGSH